MIKYRVANLKYPFRIIFYVTNKCNLKCCHCLYLDKINDRNLRDLSLYEIKTLCSFLPRKIKLLTLTGGEPFLRQDLLEICAIFLRQLHVQTIAINTNGYLCDVIEKTTLRILTESPTFNLNIQVSLDGFKETHNEIRGDEESFDRAIETIRRLKELYLGNRNFSKLSILTVVTKKNIGEIQAFSRFIKDRFNILHKLQIQRNGDLTYNELLNFYDLSYKKIPRAKSIFYKLETNTWKYALAGLNKEKRIFKCLAGKIEGIIYSGGDVGLCEQMSSIGNLKDFDYQFDRIWNSSEAGLLRDKMKNCNCANFCHIGSSICFDAETLRDVFEI
jgi:MoaA/NifB/PqqE/SkfB family radical SAM enzyme